MIERKSEEEEGEGGGRNRTYMDESIYGNMAYNGHIINHSKRNFKHER